jgi:hypothetical protein
VVLESDPNLLEGMPRIQQSTGMKLELFRMASSQEVRDKLREFKEVGKGSRDQVMQQASKILLLP